MTLQHLTQDRRLPFDDRRGPEADSDATGPTFELVVAGLLAALPDLAGAGVALLDDDGALITRAASDATVARLDGLQARLGEGPVYDCAHRGVAVVGDDLAATVAVSWPRFTAAALGEHVGAVWAFPLVVRRDRTLGVLSAYAAEPPAAVGACATVGPAFADHAAALVHAAHRVTQLNQALVTRDVIGQAKGILVERYALTPDEAFARLVASSQHANLKLRDVATYVVDETLDGRR